MKVNVYYYFFTNNLYLTHLIIVNTKHYDCNNWRGPNSYILKM